MFLNENINTSFSVKNKIRLLQVSSVSERVLVLIHHNYRIKYIYAFHRINILINFISVQT